MNTNDYVRLAMRTNADQEKIRQRMYDLGPTAAQLDNAVRGLTDEVGEVASVVKKWIEYGQTLNVTKLNEELGDCCWRIVQACDAVGLTLSDVLRANIEKLRVRYPDKYSDHRAADENRDRAREAECIEQAGGAPPRSFMQGERRTRSQVLKERQNAPAGGCCERFADNMGCDCLTNAIPDTDWRERDQQEKDALKAILLRKLDGCFCDSHDGPHPGKECSVCEAVREVLKDLEPRETVRVKEGPGGERPAYEQDGHGFGHKTGGGLEEFK